MFDLISKNRVLPSMVVTDIDKVRAFEDGALKADQIEIHTTHTFHAGMYMRTITIPAGVILTGALIKIPTVLVVQGDVVVYVGSNIFELTGYNVLPASANRKQIFFAKTDTNLTMFFPTKAQTVEDAEKEFTDEHDKLISRRMPISNTVTMNKEVTCLEQ